MLKNYLTIVPSELYGDGRDSSLEQFAEIIIVWCRSWETFLVILVVYTAWVSPFEFGFLEKSRGVLALIDNIVNVFFAIDIVLTFFVAYLDRTTYLLIDSRKQIAWRYLSTWFILDVASTIPSEIARKILPKNLRSYGVFNMLRLWRLRRVSSLFARYIYDRDLIHVVLVIVHTRFLILQDAW